MKIYYTFWFECTDNGGDICGNWECKLKLEDSL